MTLGRKVGLYTKYGKKSGVFMKLMVSKWVIFRSDNLMFSAFYGILVWKKLSFSVRFDGVYDNSFPFQKTTARKNATFFFAHLGDPPSDRASNIESMITCSCCLQS